MKNVLVCVHPLMIITWWIIEMLNKDINIDFRQFLHLMKENNLILIKTNIGFKINIIC